MYVDGRGRGYKACLKRWMKEKERERGWGKNLRKHKNGRERTKGCGE